MAKTEGRTEKFIKNSIGQFMYQAVLMGTGFVLPRIMLTYYGSQINGLVSSIGQFVSYFSLVEAGLSAATVYSLYKPLAEKNHKEISSIVCAARNFYRQSGYIFFAFVAGLAIVYPYVISPVPDLTTLQISALVFVCSASGVLDFFILSKYRALFTADQKSYVISIAMMSATISNVVIITGLAMAGHSILMTKTVALLSILIKATILVVYAHKNYSYIDYNAMPEKQALNKRWDALFQQVLSTVQLGAPTVILTIITGNLSLVSVYAIYNMIVSGIDSLLSIFVSGLAASFGEVIAKKETETLKNAYKQFETAYYLLISVIYTVAFIMIRPFVQIYTSGITDADYLVPTYAVLFIMNGFFYNLKTPQGMLVLSAGLYKETRYRSLTQGLIVVIVGCLLAKPFGIVGVLMGLILSNIYRCIDLLFFIPKNVTGVSPIYTLRHWLVMLPMAVGGILIAQTNLVQADNYVQWAGKAVIITLITAFVAVFFFAIIDFSNLKKVVERCLNWISRKKI